MKTRVELRALMVRVLRDGTEQGVVVSSFGAKPSEDGKTSEPIDLADVLEGMLRARSGRVEVIEDGADADSAKDGHSSDDGDGESESAQRKRPKAIAVAAVERHGRTLRVDFEWSAHPPRRILDLASGKTTYEGKGTDAGMNAGTVAIRVPKGQNAAYMAVEHRSGLVSVFEPALRQWFREIAEVSGFRLVTSGYIPPDFWKDFVENGTIMEMRLERHSIPRDIADVAQSDGSATPVTGGTMAIVVKVEEVGVATAVKGFFKKKWDEILSSDTEDKKGTFTYNGATYDTMKVRLSNKGIERTLTVGAEVDGRIAPAFPVEVREGWPGFPDDDDFYLALIKTLDEVLPKSP